MSSKGHGFVRLPLEPADPWFRLRYQERSLGADMFRVFGNDERLDVALDQVGEVVCRRLAVDGRDRPTVKRSVDRIIEAGLLVSDGAFTRLLYSREAYRKWSSNVRSSSGESTVNVRSMTGESTVNEQSTDGEPTVNRRSSTSEIDSTSRNHSNDDSQRDREIDREREEEIPSESAPLVLEPKKPSKRDADMAALKAAAKRLAGEYGHETTPTASTKHWGAALTKARELAPKRASFEEACEDVVCGAYERLQAGKSTSFGYALHDCAPLPPRPVSAPAKQEDANDW